jgi:hypothetical protein
MAERTREDKSVKRTRKVKVPWGGRDGLCTEAIGLGGRRIHWRNSTRRRAQAQDRRDRDAELAISPPNVAINAMTATDFMMLGGLSSQALAAGSLGFEFRLRTFKIDAVNGR